MDDADTPTGSAGETDKKPANWLQPSPASPALPPFVNPSATPRSPWVIAALVIGLAGPLVSCGLSLVLIALPRVSDRADLPLLISIFLAVGGFGLPLAWQAWQRLRGRPAFAWQSHWWWLAVCGALVVALLICGQLSISFNWLPTIVVAPLQPLIFIAAAAAVLTFTSGGWNGLSRLRAWGHLLSGAWLSVGLSFVVEVLIFGAVGLAVLIVFAALRPDQLREFVETYRAAEEIDLNLLIGWLLQPWLIVLALVLASILIPMIEELIKPIGVVLFVGQRPAPMAAFLGGVMGGLGFGVTETLGNLVSLADPWLILILARLGTLAMHGFTSGLVGWGWGQMAARRPWRLVGAYAAAVVIHGLWNALAVTAVFVGLYSQRTPQPSNMAATAILGLVLVFCLITFVLLVLACAAGLAFIGYRLRKDDGRLTAIASAASTPPEQTSAAPASAASATAGE